MDWETGAGLRPASIEAFLKRRSCAILVRTKRCPFWVNLNPLTKPLDKKGQTNTSKTRKKKKKQEARSKKQEARSKKQQAKEEEEEIRRKTGEGKPLSHPMQIPCRRSSPVCPAAPAHWWSRPRRTPDRSPEPREPHMAQILPTPWAGGGGKGGEGGNVDPG